MAKKKSDTPDASEKPAAPRGPTEWLLEATRQVPATRFALGVVAVVAVAAISVGFFLGNWLPALYGGVAAFLGMILMRVYAVSKPKQARIDVTLPVQVLVWTGVLAFVIVTILGLIGLGMVIFNSETDSGSSSNHTARVTAETELVGEQCNLLHLGCLADHLQEYRSQAAGDVQDRVTFLADTKHGNLFLSEPVSGDRADPAVRVEIRENDGHPPSISDNAAFAEIHLIPRGRNQKGYNSGKLYLDDGNVRHQFTGTIASGSTVVVIFAYDNQLNLPDDRYLAAGLR